MLPKTNNIQDSEGNYYIPYAPPKTAVITPIIPPVKPNPGMTVLENRLYDLSSKQAVDLLHANDELKAYDNKAAAQAALISKMQHTIDENNMINYIPVPQYYSAPAIVAPVITEPEKDNGNMFKIVIAVIGFIILFLIFKK